MMLFQKQISQRFLTKLSEQLANCRVKFIKNNLIKLFLSLYKVEMKEAVLPDPYAYPSFNEFFTRHLTSECRPIDQGMHALTSPVDGTIYQFGQIGADQLFHAKGFDFSLLELLAGNKQLAQTFEQGECICMYLAPYDYHRVHMPFAGTLEKMIYVPGTLYSVAPKVVEAVPKVFARNERLICLFNTTIGPMVMILVGAINVGSIHTVWAGDVNPGHPYTVIEKDYDDEAINLDKGDEMGYFQMGSTVMVLFSKNTVTWSDALSPAQHKNYGERLADAKQ